MTLQIPILRFIIINLFLSVCFLNIIGQEKKEDVSSLKEVARKPYLRIGIDPTRPWLNIIQNVERSGIAFIAETEYKELWFPVIEGGWEKAGTSRNTFNISNSGTFFRIGIDRNMLKNTSLQDRGAFTIGTRYGIGFTNNSLSDLSYSNYWDIWNPSPVKEIFATHWVEFNTGVRVEAFKNAFVGWNARLKLRAFTSKHTAEPYIAAGYGKFASSSNIDIGFFLMYSFDLHKKGN